MKIKKIKIVIAGALILMSPATGALASVPDRATATYYVAPPVSTTPQISLKGHSTTMPAVLQGYVHPAEKSYADSWYWDESTIFAARTLAYGGWCQGRLINALHFFINGNQLTFARQYIIHYAKTAAGDDLVTVEGYNANGESSGQTQYVSKLIGGKLYLKSIDRFGRFGTGHKHLDIDWTASGVKASLTQERGTSEDFVLQANKTWLKQNFDLWGDFGLRFQ
ncbi:MAG TPA: hypothetical protein V6C97_01190 [Oculatellaceae cyanobacterium]